MTTPTLPALLAALLAATTLMSTAPAAAQTPPPQPTAPPPATAVPLEDDRRILRGDRTISNEDFTLRSGETLRGDLTVFGGNVKLEERSRVEGSVTVISGDADIAGTVTENVSVVGGTARLRAGANVLGSVIRVGGSIARDPGTTIGGRITSMSLPGILSNDSLRVTVSGSSEDREEPVRWLFGVLTSAIATVLGAILITIIALLVVALFPANVAQASATAVSHGVLTGALGALTILAVPIIAVALAITICLIPISFLLLLAWGIAILAGWSVSARLVGERVMKAMNRSDWTVAGQTIAGAVLLALLGAAPILGGFIGFAASALGLGALILTRAGTQPYLPPAPASSPTSGSGSSTAPTQALPSAPPSPPSPEPPGKGLADRPPDEPPDGPKDG